MSAPCGTSSDTTTYAAHRTTTDFFGPLRPLSLPILVMNREDATSFIKDPVEQTPVRAIIRVRYDEPESLSRGVVLFTPLGQKRSNDRKTYDALFMATDKHVIPLSETGGDDWKQSFRKELSKRFPALKP